MNEADTRAELIDPLLTAAGWGVVDGSRIRREFSMTPRPHRRRWSSRQAAHGPGSIRSHPEGFGSAGARHPSSISSPLMSCAKAAMPSVTDQIPFNRRLLIAMVRSMATI